MDYALVLQHFFLPVSGSPKKNVADKHMGCMANLWSLISSALWWSESSWPLRLTWMLCFQASQFADMVFEVSVSIFMPQVTFAADFNTKHTVKMQGFSILHFNFNEIEFCQNVCSPDLPGSELYFSWRDNRCICMVPIKKHKQNVVSSMS